VRRAVALGRMALDPLAVLASLCGRGGEALSLQLHAMQDRVPPEDLARAIEKVCMGVGAAGTARWRAWAPCEWGYEAADPRNATCSPAPRCRLKL
jgi:hypothetical protein